MGHDGLIKLDKNYFKEHVDELIEEYLQSVPHLTISDEERIKAENRKLKEEQSEKHFLHEELSFVKKELTEMKERQRINELKEQQFFDLFGK